MDCGSGRVQARLRKAGLEGRGTETLFEEDQNGGFLLIEIEGNTLSGDFYDETGVLEFSRTITK